MVAAGKAAAEQAAAAAQLGVLMERASITTGVDWELRSFLALARIDIMNAISPHEQASALAMPLEGQGII